MAFWIADCYVLFHRNIELCSGYRSAEETKLFTGERECMKFAF